MPSPRPARSQPPGTVSQPGHLRPCAHRKGGVSGARARPSTPGILSPHAKKRRPWQLPGRGDRLGHNVNMCPNSGTRRTGSGRRPRWMHRLVPREGLWRLSCRMGGPRSPGPAVPEFLGEEALPASNFLSNSRGLLHRKQGRGLDTAAPAGVRPESSRGDAGRTPMAGLPGGGEDLLHARGFL